MLALFAQNNINTPAVTWAAHWAGGIVSPANPAYTVRELVHHLKDSGAKAVFTQKNLLETAKKAAKEAGIAEERVVLLGDEKVGGVLHFQEMVGVGEGMRGTRVKVDPKNDLAYLVYSSGTTGLPKGVMLTHTNVVSDLCMVNSSEGTLLKWDRDRVLSVLPYYHIYGKFLHYHDLKLKPKRTTIGGNSNRTKCKIGLQCLVHFPAYAGLTTVVMASFDLNRFCKIIQDYKITYTYVAPPVVLHLAKSPIVENYDLSSLRMITSGAAPLTKELIYKVKDRLGTQVKQAYGLSETSPVTHIQVGFYP